MSLLLLRDIHMLHGGVKSLVGPNENGESGTTTEWTRCARRSICRCNMWPTQVILEFVRVTRYEVSFDVVRKQSAVDKHARCFATRPDSLCHSHCCDTEMEEKEKFQIAAQ